ncbi:MAG: polyphosphate kinase 1 [Bacteroidetes bacterium]|nr:polyphosphate kinase 1 [Bacteroidota bacterium]
MKPKHLPRDISWLSFNARVLQDANDPTVSLQDRIRFLGIFSNNLDEFFRVRVATLKRMAEWTQGRKKASFDRIDSPQMVLDEIQRIVLRQQNEFNRIWENLYKELRKAGVYLIGDKKLNANQKRFVRNYFDEVVRPYIIPLMIENIPQFPYLRDKSLYLGIVMRDKKDAYQEKFSLIEIPARSVGRFVLLPAKPGTHAIMLLEDLIRFNLPELFTHTKYNQFEASVFKITKDAEIDMDQEVGLNVVEKLQKGLKSRRKGKPVRFIYERTMNPRLLQYLIDRLQLSRKSNIIPGGHIHHFRHFMDFPRVLPAQAARPAPFRHPSLKKSRLVSEVIQTRDVMLHFPYHSFDPVIDLLREAAMDDDVLSIYITAYRLAANSKVINAILNAARNGKQVVVCLELKARFDEEANLEWKSVLEEEGVQVLVGMPNKKVHAKLLCIRKRSGKKIVSYGFISTGNLNEKTAHIYADHCLLTASPLLMQEVEKVFEYISNWKNGMGPIRSLRHLLVAPTNMRRKILDHIQYEIRAARKGKPAEIIVKLNSLSDLVLVEALYKAAKAGVKVHLIIRGIFCQRIHHDEIEARIQSISIVDQYLEHARVMIFAHGGDPLVYISSADWMVRNLDHRVEVATPVHDVRIKQELIDLIRIQLADNQKARILEPGLSNRYVQPTGRKKIRSQEQTYVFLRSKTR